MMDYFGKNFQKKAALIIFISSFFICGCATLASRLIGGGRAVRVPQIVAHIEPALKDNKIFLLGNVVIQNPTNSSLGLEEIKLIMRDESNNIIEKSILRWDKTSVEPGHVLEAPVDIGIDLAVLNKKLISIDLQTAFTYKRFGIRIPIENKIAVLHLDFLKNSIVRPLDVTLFTKFRSGLFRAVIDYALKITNPLGIDLLLENGVIQIFSGKKEIAQTEFRGTLFKAGQSAKVEGAISIKNFFNKVLTHEFIKKSPLQFRMTGDLRVPNTEISMPFKIESIQTIDFSFFKEKESQ